MKIKFEKKQTPLILFSFSDKITEKYELGKPKSEVMNFSKQSDGGVGSEN